MDLVALTNAQNKEWLWAFRRATRGGGHGGPDPCPFFKRAKVPFLIERLFEIENIIDLYFFGFFAIKYQ